MKLLFSFLVIISLFSNVFSADSVQRPLIRHQEEQWTVGTLAKNPKTGPSLTTEYSEMLNNRNKRIISLGLNNSGLVNLNETVVMSDNLKYLDDDGVTGKLAPVQKGDKPQITQYYEEMLQDRDKRIISLKVNNTAFYDPDSQVVVKGTGEMPEVNPLDNYLVSKLEEPYLAKNPAKKPKFLEKN